MQDPSEDLAPGTIVGGRYRIHRLLGKGGMGAVYEAEHTSLGRVVALKMLLSNASANPEQVARFFQEARSAAAIGHPGIVEVFDLSQPGEPPFLVMERLEGQELRDLIRTTGRLSTEMLMPIAVELCDAVGAAHANGIVHRDLKPDNVFIARRADRSAVKVLDFGIAKLVGPRHDLSLTTTGQVFGTPLYMSPEQMRGSAIDARTDVYALGAILYEALAGHPPFDADTVTELVVKVTMDPLPPLSAVRPDVPPGLAHLIERCLAKDPAHRPGDARELAQALKAMSGASGVAAIGGPLTRPPGSGPGTSPMGGVTGPGQHSPAPYTPAPGGGAYTPAPIGGTAPMHGTPAPGGAWAPQPIAAPTLSTTGSGGAKGSSNGCLWLGIAGVVLTVLGVPLLIVVIAFGASIATIPDPDANPPPFDPALDPTVSGPSNPTGAPEPPPQPRHVQLAEKLNPLIRQCTNAYASGVHRAERGYRDWIDSPETGPTGQERYIRGVSTLSDRDGQRCARAVAESNALPPSLPELEAQASAFAEAVGTLAPILGQAHDYYELETYRDDGMARGRELHPQLMAGFEAFNEVDLPFRERLLDLEQEARLGRIEALETDPSRRTEYLVERYQYQGALVSRFANEIQLGEDRRLHLEPARQGEFIAAVEELRSRGEAISTHQDSSVSGWSSYQRDANEYTAAALRTMRALRDGEAFDRWDAQRIGTFSGWTIEGSPDALIHGYNDLLRSQRFLF